MSEEHYDLDATAYQRSDKAIFAAVGDDLLGLVVETGTCFGMEKVAAAVWQLLDEPTDLEHICARLVERYDVDVATCRDQVGDLLREMHAEGLIEKVA